MAVTTVYAGTTPNVTATFRDANGVLTDPTAITITSVSPTGTQTAYTGGQLTHASTGVYRVAIPFTVGGTWWIVGAGTGVVPVVSEMVVDVLTPHA